MRLVSVGSLRASVIGLGCNQFGPPPADSRFGRHLEPAHARHIIDRDAARVARLTAWAAGHGRGVAELAIAWLASQPGVGPVIAGATRPEQAQANASAASWTLTDDEVHIVAAIASREIVR